MLRSTTVPERNRGRSPCITARVFLVFVGIEYMLFVNSCRILCILCGLVGENYSRGSRMVLTPPLLAECSNMLIINTLSQNPAIHAIDYPTGKKGKAAQDACLVPPVGLIPERRHPTGNLRADGLLCSETKTRTCCYRTTPRRGFRESRQ